MNFGIAVFTVIEDVFLIAWLALARSMQSVLRVLAAPVLAIGLFLEHIVATNVKNGVSLVNLSGVPLGRIAVNAVLETVIWVVWLVLWQFYPFAILGVGIPIYAIAFLEIGLIVEHSLTDNIFHGRPLFQNLLNRRVIGFSTVENLGASIWLGLIGAGLAPLGVVALVLFQFIEHKMAIAVGKRV